MCSINSAETNVVVPRERSSLWVTRHKKPQRATGPLCGDLTSPGLIATSAVMLNIATKLSVCVGPSSGLRLCGLTSVFVCRGINRYVLMVGKYNLLSHLPRCFLCVQPRVLIYAIVAFVLNQKLYKGVIRKHNFSLWMRPVVVHSYLPAKKRHK